MYDKPAARKNAVWQRCMQTWQKIMRQREGAEVMDQIMKEACGSAGTVDP